LQNKSRQIIKLWSIKEIDKTMKKILFFCALIVLIHEKTYSQQVLTKEVESFDKISLFGSIEATIIKGNKESIKIESQTVDLADIKAETDEKTLKISVFDKLFSGNRQVKVLITYKELRKINASGGANLYGDSLIKSDKIELYASSGGTISLTIDVNTLTADASQGAIITLKGKTGSQESRVGSGGILSAFELDCNDTHVKSTTGGIAKVTAYNLLDAKATLGSAISYIGEPKKKDTDITLGGEIQQTVKRN
jgi:hypothetical protein